MTKESDRFRMVRTALGLSQRELAKQLGTSQAIISAIELGKTPVSRKILDLLQKKHSLNIDWFINARGEMFGTPPDSFTKIEGDDKDEIIRLLKEQNFILRQQIKDKERIITLLKSAAHTENDI